MAEETSKTQIDRLGNRLKSGVITEDDLRLLDQYRRSFADAYEMVVGAIRDKLGLEPTGRPAKSTTSIADKLKRESIRLTQIQDIAGCRIIVSDIAEQESVIQSITGLFQQVTIIDRRANPSHGYRAVHVVVCCESKLIEIQVRTTLQQVWAELSEKYSDVIDPSIKYGGGDEATKEFLQETSELITKTEKHDEELAEILTLAASKEYISDKLKQEIAALQQGQENIRRMIYEKYRSFIDELQN